MASRPDRPIGERDAETVEFVWEALRDGTAEAILAKAELPMEFVYGLLAIDHSTWEAWISGQSQPDSLRALHLGELLGSLESFTRLRGKPMPNAEATIEQEERQ